MRESIWWTKTKKLWYCPDPEPVFLLLTLAVKVFEFIPLVLQRTKEQRQSLNEESQISNKFPDKYSEPFEIVEIHNNSGPIHILKNKQEIKLNVEHIWNNLTSSIWLETH